MIVDSILPHAESGPNDHRKDALPFTRYELVIKKNVIIDGIPDRWDIDEYLKDIEDVWGYVVFENNAKIDSGKFLEKIFVNSNCITHRLVT